MDFNMDLSFDNWHMSFKAVLPNVHELQINLHWIVE